MATSRDSGASGDAGGDLDEDVNKSSELEENPIHTASVVKDDGPFSDEVYKRLACINGEINRLTKAEIMARLSKLGMDTRGVKEVLKKRLKNHYKRRKLKESKVSRHGPQVTPYDFIIVIDFEATCEANCDNYDHEIIEFPAILVDVAKNEIVGEFHSYCRPVLNAKLSKFCIGLTGITQHMVDVADFFPDVLAKYNAWMKENELGRKSTYAIATDGKYGCHTVSLPDGYTTIVLQIIAENYDIECVPWDMGRFMFKQCTLSQIPFPKWAKTWINVRKAYSNFYETRRMNITRMLENIGHEVEGTLHCGRDDARNIARICMCMLRDGCVMIRNEKLTSQYSGSMSEVKSVKKSSGRNGSARKAKNDSVHNNSLMVEACSIDNDIEKELEKLTLYNDDADGGDNYISDLMLYHKLQTN